MNRCSPAKKLMEIHHIDRPTANKVRWAWREATRTEVKGALGASFMGQFHNDPVTRSLRRYLVNKYLQTHGVEFLGFHKRNGHEVYYCNTGCMDAATVMFIGPRAYVGCESDLTEAGLIRQPKNLY